MRVSDVAEGGVAGRGWQNVSVIDRSDEHDRPLDATSASLEQSARVVYKELRALAGSYFRVQRPDHTLQPTALVNEAFVKLAGNPELAWASREHFFSIAAKAMREILADHAKRRRTLKRGSGWERVTLSVLSDDESSIFDALELDEALDALRDVSERQVEIIELRYYGGLSVEESASVLGVSARTVELDSRMARAWLLRRLNEASHE